MNSRPRYFPFNKRNTIQDINKAINLVKQFDHWCKISNAIIFVAVPAMFFIIVMQLCKVICIAKNTIIFRYKFRLK